MTSERSEQPPSDVERRSFLKLAGAAAAGTVGASSIGTAAAAQEYEVWTVTSPEIYDIDDGEVLSNVLIDQTDPDGSLTIRSRNSSDWEVRNVGFLGVGNTDGEGSYQFLVSAPSGSQGLIENVYMYGKDDPRGTELGGILIRSSHGGHLDIRHTYIEGFGNNAVYGSNCHPDDGGNGGTVTIENAFHRDNTVAQFRLGTDGSTVRNSVGIVNNPSSDEELRGNYYTSNDEFNARGMWARWDGEVTIENSTIYVSGDDIQPDAAFNSSQGANLTIVDCDVNSDVPQEIDECSDCDITVESIGNDPTVDVIDGGGVPLSAEMAASGERSMPTPEELPEPDSGSDDGMTGEPTLDRTLTVDGNGADRTDYEFTVSGSFEENPDVGSLGGGDEIDGDTASGFVNGGVDGYRFAGEITDATVNGNASILVDGQEVSPEDFADEQIRTLTIDGSNADYTDYSVTVDGELEATDSIGVGDEIDGNTATGFVNGGSDTYRFSGEITDLSRDGDALILIDGEEVAPEDFANEQQRTLTIDGSNADYTDYSVTVDGELEATDSIGVGDEIDGNTATGFVNGGSDVYEFVGEITDLTRDGDATIFVDGEEVFPEDFADEPELPNTITFDGRNDDRPGTYSFSVSGDLTFDSETSNDGIDVTVDGDAASGSLIDQLAAFQYSGDLVDLNVTGTVNIQVDDVDG